MDGIANMVNKDMGDQPEIGSYNLMQTLPQRRYILRNHLNVELC